ncbi:MAG: methyltransferase [Lentisphaeria bacterium]|nr:methyltransferase [Lentisphaeria bacterium]
MLEKFKKYLMRRARPVVFADASRREPVSRDFGVGRGMPVDRYYIERFLAERSRLIRGEVLEISEDTYTRRFGSAVAGSSILTFDRTAAPPALFGDLTCRETLPEKKFDCFIATQTLNFIPDAASAVENAAFLLREEGVFLGTVAGLSQVSRFDRERWGDYWRFTDMGLAHLLGKSFSRVEVTPLGNFAAARLFLDGLAVEDLPSRDVLDGDDPDYAVVIGFEARR